MSEPRELEAKFEASHSAIDALLRLESFGRFTVTSRSVKEQHDCYYDTEQGHLKAAGASLRIRYGHGEPRMTFKGTRRVTGDGGHVVSRLEDEVDVDPGKVEHLSDHEPLSIDPPPSPLQRARSLAGDTPLVPTARMRTSRTVLLASVPDGDQVELAVDRCRATRLVDMRETDFVEVEIELMRGDEELLSKAIADLERDVDGLTPSTRTKLERALD